MLTIDTSITTVDETEGSCLQCGKRFELPSAFCPRCGTRRQGEAATPMLMSRRRQTFYFKSCTAAVLILVIGIISVAARKPRPSNASTPQRPRISAPARTVPMLDNVLKIDPALATQPVVLAPTTRPVAVPAKPPVKRNARGSIQR